MSVNSVGPSGRQAPKSPMQKRSPHAAIEAFEPQATANGRGLCETTSLNVCAKDISPLPPRRRMVQAAALSTSQSPCRSDVAVAPESALRQQLPEQHVTTESVNHTGPSIEHSSAPPTFSSRASSMGHSPLRSRGCCVTFPSPSRVTPAPFAQPPCAALGAPLATPRRFPSPSSVSHGNPATAHAQRRSFAGLAQTCQASYSTTGSGNARLATEPVAFDKHEARIVFYNSPVSTAAQRSFAERSAEQQCGSNTSSACMAAERTDRERHGCVSGGNRPRDSLERALEELQRAKEASARLSDAALRAAPHNEGAWQR